MGNANISTEQFNKIQMDNNFLSKPQIAMFSPQNLIGKMGEILFDYQKTMLNGDYLTMQNILARLYLQIPNKNFFDEVYSRVYGEAEIQTDGVWATDPQTILSSTNWEEIPLNQEAGEPPFSCKYQDCGQAFMNQEEAMCVYQDHLQEQHSGEESNIDGEKVCPFCDATFDPDNEHFEDLTDEHIIFQHGNIAFDFYFSLDPLSSPSTEARFFFSTL